MSLSTADVPNGVMMRGRRSGARAPSLSDERARSAQMDLTQSMPRAGSVCRKALCAVSHVDKRTCNAKARDVPSLVHDHAGCEMSTCDQALVASEQRSARRLLSNRTEFGMTSRVGIPIQRHLGKRAVNPAADCLSNSALLDSSKVSIPGPSRQPVSPSGVHMPPRVLPSCTSLQPIRRSP
jgi:hypothetical protein